jgi:hypothetical protein
LFLSRFGPLKLCVGKVRSVLAEGRLWFHGNGDRDQCLRLLDNMPSNDKVPTHTARPPDQHQPSKH